VKPDDIVPVKYTEDLAQFAEVRPVVRQPMTLRELVGLVLATTGKQPARVRELLRGGTCTYNIYRYWWDAIDLDDAALAAALREFPDPDPARAFRAGDCVWVNLSDAGEPTPHAVLIERAEAARRRWLRAQSFWSFLMELAGALAPAYVDYSYYHLADLYRAELAAADRARLADAVLRLAPRGLQERLARGFGAENPWARLELACPRR